jgi:hypothetical protein
MVSAVMASIMVELNIAPVTEPFDDAHPAAGGGLSQRGPQLREHQHHLLVAVAICERREPTEIHERKRTVDPHSLIMTEPAPTLHLQLRQASPAVPPLTTALSYR